MLRKANQDWNTCRSWRYLNRVLKKLGREENEERPELVKVVLEGCSGEQEARDGADGLELLDEAAGPVLDAVALVEDEVLPLVSLEVRAVDHADLDHNR